MAEFAKGTEVSVPHYKELMAELEKLTTDKKLIANKMAIAMRFAAKPSFDALKANVARIGKKSGNLERATALKVKKYPQSGNAVALVGFIAAGSSAAKQKGKGKDRAYHQHFIERGTKQRMVKGNIASSYKRGIFSIAKAGGSLKTTNYPMSFFKRGKAGQTLTTGKMPVGGRLGKPPIEDAYNKTKSQINSRLVEKTGKAIDSLMKSLKKAEGK